MSRSGWNLPALAVRYEHASEERDALLAKLNQYAEGTNVDRTGDELERDRARRPGAGR